MFVIPSSLGNGISQPWILSQYLRSQNSVLAVSEELRNHRTQVMSAQAEYINKPTSPYKVVGKRRDNRFETAG
jgi:hypothetical protein